VTQSYANSGGTGNRTSLVTVTTTAGIGAGSIYNLVDGSQANTLWWSPGQSGREIVFGFGGTGFTRCINEAKWYQDLAATHGDWKWQGSNDLLAWTDIGATFTLGGTLQTITTLSGNTNFWRYYRLLQVSGTTSNTPWLREIEFSIDDGGGVPVAIDARLTEIAAETWAIPVPLAQATQIGVEVWASATSINQQALITQIGIETWASVQIATQTINPELVTNDNVIYGPTVSTVVAGTRNVFPGLVVNNSVIHPPTVTTGTANILPPPLPHENIVFPPTVKHVHPEPEPGTPGPLRTILNTNWLNSLVLNILNTRARNDAPCPSPAAVYGHWSESYREDGMYIGAKFWSAAEKSYVRVADAVKMIGISIESDLNKLVQMRVAKSVSVVASYVGNNQVGVEITITSSANINTDIKLTGAMVVGGWEWR
jgi:phage gp46-like protein